MRKRAGAREEGRTCRNLLIRVKLLEQTDSVVYHVRLLREFILGCLDLFDGEYLALCEVGEEREDQMAVAVGNDRFCEVVLGHFEVQTRAKPRGDRIERRARRG